VPSGFAGGNDAHDIVVLTVAMTDDQRPQGNAEAEKVAPLLIV
jgi:hypothetical protein